MNKEFGKRYRWTGLVTKDLYKFFGLLIYMSLVSLPSLQDYWRQDHILSVSLSSKVMSRGCFGSIFWNIHLSDSAGKVHHNMTNSTESDPFTMSSVMHARLFTT